MESYKIDPVIYANNLRKRTNIFIGIMVTAVLIASVGPIKDYFTKPGTNSLITLGIILAVCIPYFIFLIKRMLKKSQEAVDVFSLKVTHEALTKRSIGSADQTIALADIQKIYQHKNGTLLIYAANNKKPMVIPWSLENRAQLELQLRQLVPFEKSSVFVTGLPVRLVLAILSIIIIITHSIFKYDWLLYLGLLLMAIYLIMRYMKK